ncbi:hypothetical protein ACLRGI_14840 [Paenarthrobacter nitroguajacolicus]
MNTKPMLANRREGTAGAEGAAGGVHAGLAARRYGSPGYRSPQGYTE